MKTQSNQQVSVIEITDSHVVETMARASFSTRDLDSGPFVGFYVVVTAIVDGDYSMVHPPGRVLAWVFGPDDADDLGVDAILGSTMDLRDAPDFIRNEFCGDDEGTIHDLDGCTVVPIG